MLDGKKPVFDEKSASQYRLTRKEWAIIIAILILIAACAVMAIIANKM
jgi:hypothetical protein